MKDMHFPIEITCDIFGENFKPSQLKNIIENGIILKDITNLGEIGAIGRYKNKSVPYGSCCFEINETIAPVNRIIFMCDFIKKYKVEFIKVGATDITMSIFWYGLQGNMEFTSKELQNIASLDIPLNMNYVYLNENEIRYS
jgi:hypothetical protein